MTPSGRAAKHLPNRLKESFREQVLEYKDIFRIRLGCRSACRYSAHGNQVRRHGTPCQGAKAHVSPEQLDFMKKKCDELLNVGYIYREPFVEMGLCPTHCSEGWPGRI